MAKMTMTKEKFSGLDGRTYSRWTESDSREPRPFMVEVSPSGIRLKGTMQSEMEDEKELEVFAEIITQAMKELIAFRKEVRATLAGDPRQ